MRGLRGDIVVWEAADFLIEGNRGICYDKVVEGSRLRREVTDLNQAEKHKFSLNKIIILLFAAGYTIVLALLLILDWVLVKNYHAKKEQTVENRLKESVGEIENAVDEIDSLLYQICLYDDDFVALSSSSYYDGRFNDEMYELTETLKIMLSLDQNFHGYFIFYDGEEGCRYRTNLADITSEEAETLKNILSAYCPGTVSDGAGAMVQNRWIAVMAGDNPVLAVSYSRNQATFFAVYSMKKLENDFRAQWADARVLYTNGDSCINDPEFGKQLRLEAMLKEQGSVYSGRTSGWKLYSRRVPRTELWITAAVPVGVGDYFTVGMLLLLMAELLFAAAFLMVIVFVRREVLHPLRELVDRMNEIRDGEEPAVVQKDYRVAELQNVDDTLYRMISELRTQRLAAYENIIAKQKAVMQYLRLQLNPHFYLNGLKSLQVLAQKKETENMQELILLLAKNLRYLMAADRETISLEKELDFCQSYIELRKRTTGLNPVYEVYCEEETRACMVPVLCIQTFLENSCKYAKRPDPSEELKIDVAVRFLDTEDQRLLDITVRDNGPGYPADVLEQLSQPPDQEPEEEGKQIGIDNLRRRCRILYGDRAEMFFYNEEGAVSEMLLPVKGGDGK